MSTLYELTNEFLQLLQMAEDPEMDVEALESCLEGIEFELEIKADGYAKVIAELEGKIAGLNQQIERMEKYKKSIGTAIDRMMASLEKSMRLTGKTDFQTELFKFKIKKNPASVELAEGIDFGTIDPEYITWGKPSVNKTAVKNAMKNGKKFEWAKLVNKEVLKIN